MLKLGLLHLGVATADHLLLSHPTPSILHRYSHESSLSHIFGVCGPGS